ncbi:hypothetical protein [Flavobacterium fontis]|uniref:hypothetical protein n=1 Tax=Flavobacterium fontis TaxID=1124188 RepID=UPI000932DB69|nr:hypothetical protein [Flavobacterium fontis]
MRLREKLSETLCSRSFTIKVFKVSRSAEYRLRKTKTALGRELVGLKIFVILGKTSRTLRNLCAFAVKYIVRLREKLSETLCSRSFTIKVFKVSRSAEYRLRKTKTALGREIVGLKIFVILGKTSRTLRNLCAFAVKYIVRLREKLSETLCSKGFTIKVFKVSQSAEYRLRKTKTAKGRELGGLKIFVILGKTSRTLRNLCAFAVKKAFEFQSR